MEGRPDGRPSAVPETSGERTIALDGARPARAEGVEMLGAYDGSGLKETPYLARRADGQVIQLPQVLYAIAEASDGNTSLDDIAARASEAAGARIDPADAGYLIVEKLVPLGLVAPLDGSRARVETAKPFLALQLKTKVVPARAVAAITRMFRPLVWPPVMIAMLCALAAFDVWFFGVHGVAQSVRGALYHPAVILLFFALVVASAAFHECGHATACAKAGARPGEMGAGLYVAWPVFYTDVTDAYRLGRGGRLLTDIGGVYFNCVFALLLAGAYFVTGFEPLLLFIVLQHFEIIHQFLPFVRLDGYYMVADLTGVPDLFARIGPILRSAIPGRRADPRVKELKPWVRAVVTLWVLAIVPVLLFLLAITIVHLPRILATGADSLGKQWNATARAFGSGNVLHGLAGCVGMFALLVPLVALPYTLVRAFAKLGVLGWRKTEGKPFARAVFATAATLVLAFFAFTMIPNGDYKPIQPGERGTIGDSVAALRTAPSGNGGLASYRRAGAGSGSVAPNGAAPAGARATTAPGAGTGAAPSAAPSGANPSATAAVTGTASPSAGASQSAPAASATPSGSPTQ
jgi:putative peptide zinc metalloprotease protein